MKIQAQAIKLPKKEEEELKLIPLANDRALEANEEEAEEKAVKLPRKQFKRIPPGPGTLGYLFRDIQGGNRAVFDYINNSLDLAARQKSNTIAYKIYRVILMWNALDEYSQNRVDVFDWLCEKVGVPKDRFYGQAAVGMFDHHEAISQRILLESKPELLNNLRQLGQKEKNFRDRELLAKATGIAKDAPLIGSIDASTKVVNNSLTFESGGFRETLRSTEKLLKQEEFIDVESTVVDEQKQLPEANLENMIDVNMFSKEELLLELERK